MTKYRFGFQPFIFVDTNFKRKNEPIFALAALEPSRNIRIVPIEICDLPLDDQIPLIKEIIQRHFLESKGICGIWGKIACYKYFYEKDAAIIFDLKGSQIRLTDESLPNQAKVLVKGKKLI